jgi:hypothetical protein
MTARVDPGIGGRIAGCMPMRIVSDRGGLYGEIRRRLALRPDHAVRRGWGAVLHVARRLG